MILIVIRVFVDDVGMYDCGVGEPPVVDMGAYEFQGSTCFGDIDFDGLIGIADLAELLGELWRCGRVGVCGWGSGSGWGC